MTIVKAHAYGNDFILASDADIQASADRAALTRILCDRHRGIGADGVIFHRATAGGAAMDLLNADGSYSEVSGNGVRCLAAWIARQRSLSPGASVLIQTDAGAKSLELLAIEGSRHTFRAAMGHPEQVSRRTIALDGTSVDVVTLRVGNPQCVVLGALSTERLHRIAGPLAVHPSFPAGTNVELASVESPERVRILIWNAASVRRRPRGRAPVRRRSRQSSTAAPLATSRWCPPAARSVSSGVPTVSTSPAGPNCCSKALGWRKSASSLRRVLHHGINSDDGFVELFAYSIERRQRVLVVFHCDRCA